MHYVMRSKYIILGLILTLVLASCGTPVAPEKVNADNGEIYYIAKVEIEATDTKSEIESEYGAKAIFFNNEAGFAVLGFTKEAGELTSLTTFQNQNAFAVPEVTAQGYNAWAGGYNAWAGGYNAWAGGYNAWAGGYNAWAGGYNAWAGGYNAWAGGYNAWAGGLPMESTVGDNIHIWDRTNLAEGQLRAPNLGKDVVIAVIDTGVDLYHPALSGHLTSWQSRQDFVDYDNEPYDEGDLKDHGLGHGTAVAALILQVAPNAKIMPLRVLDKNGNGDTDDVVSAISWAMEHGADIINLSLGTDIDDPSLLAVISWASSQGIFVISSAGNSNSENVTYPAAYTNSLDRVISVGSVDLHNKKSSFSNYSSSKLDIVIPGEGLVTAFPDNKKVSVSGTSFTAPITTGALALALGQNPSSGKIANIKAYLRNYSTNIDSANPSYINKLGGGLLDIERFMSNMGFAAPNPSRKALFVVGHLPLGASDEFIKERLEQLGFNVSIYLDQYSSAGQANNQDLVVISNTVNENKVNTKFRDVAVPVITWEDALYGPMSMAYDSGDVSSQDRIRINKNHPLAMGFSMFKYVGVYNESNDPYEHRLAYGKPYSAAIKVATVPGDASKVVIFAYEKGAALGTIHAPAKRVGMFFQNYDDLSLSNFGAGFFDTAVVWATSKRHAVNSHNNTWLEAESPSSISGGFDWHSDAAWVVSGGSYMTVPEGFANDYDGDGNPNAKLSYKLKVATSGTYNVWFRGYGSNSTSDSFWIQTDGGSKRTITYIPGDWRWVKVSKYLSAGEHVLTVSLREDGTKLDKILITANSGFTPYGLGDY